MDIEQPQPADASPEHEEPQVVQPDFDEQVEALSDVSDRAEDFLTQQYLTGVGSLAQAPATYWLTLRKAGLPAQACTDLTTEWMEICAGVEDDDENWSDD